MNKSHWRGPAVFAVLLLAANATHAQPGLFGLDAYSGAELFGRFCASCHGEEGRGDGPVAATMSVPVPDLTREAARNGGTFPAARLAEIIDGRSPVVAHGARQMPVWGFEFWWEAGADRAAEPQARETIDRLVEFLRTIQETP